MKRSHSDDQLTAPSGDRAPTLDRGERGGFGVDLPPDLSRIYELAEAFGDALSLHDLSGRFQHVSAAVIELTGRAPEELLNLQPAPLVWRNVTRASGQPVEWRHPRADGREQWLETRAVLLRSPEGAPRAYVAVTRDITARKVAEAGLREREERLRIVAETTGDVIYRVLFNPMRYDFVSPAIEALTGYSVPEMMAHDLAPLVEEVAVPGVGSDPQAVRAFAAATRQGAGSEYLATYRIRTKGGEARWVEDHSLPFRDEHGQAIGSVGVLRDITPRKRIEEQLEIERIKLRAVVDGAPDPIHLKDRDGRYLLLNPAAQRWTGLTPEEALGHTDQELFGEHVNLAVQDADREVIETREARTVELTAEIDGEERSLLTTKVPYFAPDGQVLGVIGISRDITERRRAERELHALTERLSFDATHDPLTGLPNRLLAQDRLEQALHAARRSGRMVAALFIDLDRFKGVNDTMGHGVGDHLLQGVTARWRQVVRASDTFARRGGDEFMLILHDLSDESAAAVTAKKLLDALREPFSADGHELFASASIGVSVFPRDGEDAETLQRNADVAMYRAKARGGQGFECFTPEMSRQAHQRLELETELRQALELGEIIPYYQAQVDAASGRIVAFEALARWRHPRLGLIGPSRFLPIAVESGLVRALDEYMLRAVCAQAAAWRAAGLPPVRVAVNVSNIRYGQRDLTDLVRAALLEQRLDPSWLELEMTESFIMRDAAAAGEQFARLHALGVTVAVDDFGAGYSSLAYLQALPFDRLKIDRGFVERLGEDAQAKPLIEAMITLARSLGLPTIVEGVETPRHLTELQGLGCEVIQGYLFARPVSARRLAEHLREHGLKVGDDAGRGAANLADDHDEPD